LKKTCAKVVRSKKGNRAPTRGRYSFTRRQLRKKKHGEWGVSKRENPKTVLGTAHSESWGEKTIHPEKGNR